MWVFRIVFINVKTPISFVTSGQFNDRIAAKNNVESRDNCPFESTDLAVFCMLPKNFSKSTKWLMGMIFPLFETYIQLTTPHSGLHENRGHGFFMNFLMIMMGETITDIGKKSAVVIWPWV